MKDEQKSKKQLISELIELRGRIAELEKSELQPSQEEQLFHILRISSPVGLFILQDGKFQFLNDVFRGVTGGSPDELLAPTHWRWLFLRIEKLSERKQ